MLETSSARNRHGGGGSAQRADDKPVVIETRFGSLEFGPDNSLYMPVGPLGFTDFHHFGLAELPKPAAEHFKLLQCLDSHELGFIVTELAIDDGRVAQEDLEDAALSVGIPVDSARFLLIVTIRAVGENPRAADTAGKTAGELPECATKALNSACNSRKRKSQNFDVYANVN